MHDDGGREYKKDASTMCFPPKRLSNKQRRLPRTGILSSYNQSQLGKW